MPPLKRWLATASVRAVPYLSAPRCTGAFRPYCFLSCSHMLLPVTSTLSGVNLQMRAAALASSSSRHEDSADPSSDSVDPTTNSLSAEAIGLLNEAIAYHEQHVNVADVPGRFIAHSNLGLALQVSDGTPRACDRMCSEDTAGVRVLHSCKCNSSSLHHRESNCRPSISSMPLLSSTKLRYDTPSACRHSLVCVPCSPISAHRALPCRSVLRHKGRSTHR